MRINSSYKIKLTGDLKALEASINIYRQTLSYIIPIINNNWARVKGCQHTNQKYNMIDKWIHSTINRQALFDFDQQFPKLPSYLRRSAIANALGIVSSYRSNLKNWEKEPVGQSPKLSLTHYDYPAYYKNNLFRKFDPINHTNQLPPTEVGGLFLSSVVKRLKADSLPKDSVLRPYTFYTLK